MEEFGILDASFRDMLAQLHDGLYVVDRDRKILFWNVAAERLTGYSAEETIGRPCADNILVHVNKEGENLCTELCPLAHTLNDGQLREADIFLHHKQGHRVPVSVRVAPLCDNKGAIVGAVELFSDNTPKLSALELAASLEALALTDGLTSVGNRRYADLSLDSKLDEMRRNGLFFGLLFLDLDHLKTINDNWGHQAGDAALKIIAKTATGLLRTFDFIARWGGDEFLVLLPNVRDKDILENIAERLRILVNTAFFEVPGGELFHPSISIGGSICQPDDTRESLLARADKALYQSKQGGRNRVTIG